MVWGRNGGFINAYAWRVLQSGDGNREWRAAGGSRGVAEVSFIGGSKWSWMMFGRSGRGNWAMSTGVGEGMSVTIALPNDEY